MKKILFCLICVLSLTFGFVSSITALTPAFDVTNIYKSSLFYERLVNLELTGDQRRDIINVAISQLGYHEGASQNDFDGMNWEGNSNYVEYNYANRSIYSNGNTYSYAWCASFVTWCARQAGISSNVVINSVSCDKFVSDFKSKSQYKTRASGYLPIAGDLIFFLSEGAERQYASHIGIVVGRDSSQVYTIEGNTSRGLVNYRSYSLTDSYIVGYAVPSYSGTKNDYSDFKLKDGYVEPGEYKVTASSLNMRESYTTSSSVIASIPNGKVIVITDVSGDWGKTSYNGKNGWVHLSYVTPVRLEQYVITYNANGGEGAPTQTKKTAGVNITLSSAVPQRTGYDFLGWSKSKTSSKVDFRSGDTYKDNADLTLYAVWEITEVTVIFLDYDNTVISTKTYKYGEKIELPEISETRSDGEYIYTFEGWDKTVLENAKVDRTYTAVYSKVKIDSTDVGDTSASEETEESTEQNQVTTFDNVTSSDFDEITAVPKPNDTSASNSRGCAGVDLTIIFAALIISCAVVVIKRKI